MSYATNLLIVINKNKMLGRDDNYRRGRFIDPEGISKKYTYLAEESSGNVSDFDRRTNVLETISEEAISEHVSNRT